MGASNKVILCSHDTIHQPSANTSANLCPDHLKSDRIFSRFCWSQPKMDSGVILWLWGTWKVNSSALNHLFLEAATKKMPKPPKFFLHRSTNVTFTKSRGWSRKKRKLRVVWNHALCSIQRFNPLITDLFLGAKDSGKLFSSVALLFNDFRRLESQSPLTRANDYDAAHSYHGVHIKWCI